MKYFYVRIRTDRCFECGSEDNIHQHHIVPVVRGGKQVIPLCGDCHGKVHGKRFGMDWKTLQRDGIEKAKQNDPSKYVGRKQNSKESIEHFLNKPKSKLIIKDLKKGYTLTDICELRKCSFNLIYKVKELIE
jgi:hypothetical protein